jgi:hypothetical protein
MDRDKMSNLYKGPSTDASYQVWVHLAEGFQRRRLKCEKLTDDRRRTPSDGKSSRCLWQGELKISHDQISFSWRHFISLKPPHGVCQYNILTNNKSVNIFTFEQHGAQRYNNSIYIMNTDMWQEVQINNMIKHMYMYYKVLITILQNFAMPVSVNKSDLFISFLNFKTFGLLHIFLGKNLALTLLKKVHLNK